MTDAALSPEEQLIEDIAGFTHDPLGYALYAFPWGEDGTELAHATGPRQWQADAFREIRDHLQNPETRYQPLMLARASGHGIGKSAFISMLINWGMSTCEDCKVVVTANTDNQLRTKTWPEIIKWSNLAITKDWFEWEYLHSGFGIARITAVNGTTATAEVISYIPSQVVGEDNASYKWAKYAWNSVNGYPGTVVYYQQRLYFAASTAFPQTIWASRTGDYKDFGKSNPTQDDDRIIYTYAGRQVNEIRHLIDVGSLVALTSGGEYVITGDQNKVLTGADLSTGNALDIFGDTAQFGALDSLTTVNNAQREAYGYQVQAANYKAEASSARKQGNVGAATTLLTAPLKAYGAYQMFGGTWSPFTQSTPAPIGAAAGTRLPGGL